MMIPTLPWPRTTRVPDWRKPVSLEIFVTRCRGKSVKLGCNTRLAALWKTGAEAAHRAPA